MSRDGGGGDEGSEVGRGVCGECMSASVCMRVCVGQTRGTAAYETIRNHAARKKWTATEKGPDKKGREGSSERDRRRAGR